MLSVPNLTVFSMLTKMHGITGVVRCKVEYKEKSGRQHVTLIDPVRFFPCQILEIVLARFFMYFCNSRPHVWFLKSFFLTLHLDFSGPVISWLHL